MHSIPRSDLPKLIPSQGGWCPWWRIELLSCYYGSQVFFVFNIQFFLWVKGIKLWWIHTSKTNLSYLKRDRSNWQQSNIPPILRKFGWSKFTLNRTINIYGISVVHWTAVHLNGPNQRNTSGPLDHWPFGQICFVRLDGLRISYWTGESSSGNPEKQRCQPLEIPVHLGWS